MENPGSGFDLKVRDVEKEKRASVNLSNATPAPHNFVTPGTIITREPGFMRFLFYDCFDYYQLSLNFVI